MKRSLLAVSVLGAFAGVASAQSSVTLYGTLDVNGRDVKNDGSGKRLSMNKDGLNSAQFGVKGIEDLGGGLKAGFLLVSSVNAGSGDIGSGQSATGSGKFWNRRSTVSLFSNLGELRLGRDYIPSFWNQSVFDESGANGLGNSQNVEQLASSTAVRADNNIGYFLPGGLGGFYGQVNLAAAQGGATAQAGQTGNAGRYIGGRLGFAAGPFDVAFSAATQRTQTYNYTLANQGVVATTTGVQDSYNLGGSYDFGVLKVEGYVDREKINALKETRGNLSVIVPIGLSEIHLAYNRSKLTNGLGTAGDYTNSIWMANVTYVYNLSKRTAVYGTLSDLDNGNHSRLAIAGGTSITAAPTIGGVSKGFEAGIRHFF